MSEITSPLVSVGIPTYNQPEYLRQAIQSVLNQTFQDFEIIIVDDCSTDNTPEIVKAFGDHRIRYYKTEANLRPPKSWNACVRLARGQFFAILPHDDVWLSDFLEVMVDTLRQNPDVGFSQCNFYGVNERLTINKPESQLRNTKSAKGVEAVDWHLQHLRCNPAAILFRLEKMKSAGLWREDYWDDWAFIIRLSYSFGFCFIPTYHAAVRAHENNLCKVLAEEGRIGGFYVLDQLFDVFGHTLPQSPESLALYSKVIRRLSISLFFTAVKLVLQGDRSRACQAYHYSRRINPVIPLDYEILLHLFRRILKRQDASNFNAKRSADFAVITKDQSYLRSLFSGN